MAARLDISGLDKTFGAQPVLRDLSLSVEPGEFLALLGPSGCGKSTLLAILAGFERPDRGHVTRDGVDLLAIPAHKRRLGYVPQDYAMFSRMTVRGNLEFGLKRAHLAVNEQRRRFENLVERMALQPLLALRPAALNMSEMQRVALARALAAGPSLILLDEPMSNLDAALREHLRAELKAIQREFGETVVYVTHDQIEAMTMADRIAVMRDGRIEQLDAPLTLYRRPRNRHVADFIGEPSINFLDATIQGGTLHVEGSAIASLLPEPGRDRIEIGIRPYDLRVSHTAMPGSIALLVEDIERLGAEHLAIFRLGPQSLTAVVPRGFATIGDTVHVCFDPAGIHFFDADGNAIAVRRNAQERAA
jgi:multiple sugar transport system ATP-binding protein